LVRKRFRHGLTATDIFATDYTDFTDYRKRENKFSSIHLRRCW